MIHVEKPQIIECGENTKVVYPVMEGNEKKECVFVFDKCYRDYLSCDRGDGILTMLFMYAMKNGQDIKLDIPVSARLYYQLINYMIDALTYSTKGQRAIKIEAELTSETYPKINKRVVATGMSLGVDSLCTFYTHNVAKNVPDYKINLLTFFNVGAFTYGDGIDIEGEFEMTKRHVISFAEEVNMPLLIVDSNLANIFHMDHGFTDTVRNGGIVLMFQKLIDVYYYSSTYVIDEFVISMNKEGAYYDIYTMQNISTDNTTFYSSNPAYTRMRKIEEIANWDLAQKYMCVCIQDGEGNCGVCWKCSKTLAALDACDSVDKFGKVFDLQLWHKRRNMVLGYAAASKNEVYYDAIAPILSKKKKYTAASTLYRVLFTVSKPIEKGMRKLSVEKRRKWKLFAKKHNIRVPF